MLERELGALLEVGEVREETAVMEPKLALVGHQHPCADCTWVQRKVPDVECTLNVACHQDQNRGLPDLNVTITLVCLIVEITSNWPVPFENSTKICANTSNGGRSGPTHRCPPDQCLDLLLFCVLFWPFLSDLVSDPSLGLRALLITASIAVDVTLWISRVSHTV